MGGFIREETLNLANITDLPVTLSALRDAEGRGFGSLIRGVGVPAKQSFSGLDSSATHTAPYPGWVFGITTGGANKTLIYAGAAGAGEVLVEYQDDGRPKLTFGDGAVVAYDLWQAAMPVGLGDKLDQAP
ncbi:MAG: hypothetical protein M0R28_18100 [Pigmentiphaga sp.]|nr:hypothetical protein [Pigmentiphaga sp.]